MGFFFSKLGSLILHIILPKGRSFNIKVSFLKKIILFSKKLFEIVRCTNEGKINQLYLS